MVTRERAAVNVRADERWKFEGKGKCVAEVEDTSIR
jgi:hypothetical protein